MGSTYNKNYIVRKITGPTIGVSVYIIRAISREMSGFMAGTILE